MIRLLTQLSTSSAPDWQSYVKDVIQKSLCELPQVLSDLEKGRERKGKTDTGKQKDEKGESNLIGSLM